MLRVSAASSSPVLASAAAPKPTPPAAPKPATPTPPAAPKPATPAAAATPKAKPGTLRTETLPNGVRIIMNDRPGAKDMNLFIGIGAGSLQDPVGKVGMAHLVEHLSFEGNNLAPTQRKVDAELQEQGSFGDAFTDNTHIVWNTTSTNNDAVKAARLYSNMFLHPNTNARAVDKEKVIVTREMQYTHSTRASDTWREATRLLLGDQPLAGDVIGTPQSVDKVTKQDLDSFVKQYFVGRNTSVLLDGDPKKMPLAEIRKDLGQLAPGARVDNTRLFTGFRKGALAEVVPDHGDSSVTLDVFVPLPEDKTTPLKDGALRVARNIVSNALMAKLRETDHITYNADAAPFADNAGTFEALDLSTMVTPDRVKQAVQDIAHILKEAPEMMTDANVKAVKTMLRKRTIATPPAQTSTSSFNQFLSDIDGDTKTNTDIKPDSATTLAAIAKVTAADARKTRVLDLSQIKILARGPITSIDQIQAGLDAAGVNVKLTHVPFNSSYYQQQTSRS